MRKFSKTKGGGLKLCINNTWCNNITITSTTYNSKIKAFTVNYRPFYLPEEFTIIYIIVVYLS